MAIEFECGIVMSEELEVLKLVCLKKVKVDG